MEVHARLGEVFLSDPTPAYGGPVSRAYLQRLCLAGAQRETALLHRTSTRIGL